MSKPTAAALEPMISLNELAATLNTSRRTVERLRSAGKIPKPDMVLGNRPKWAPATIRGWIASQAGTN